MHDAVHEDAGQVHLVGVDLAGLDDAAFRALFAGTPVKRTGRDRPPGTKPGWPMRLRAQISSASSATPAALPYSRRASEPPRADYMLYLNHHKIDRKVPFRIVHEDTPKRYLTGADFDTEGFQIIGDNFWIGDEFGPYILKTDMTGKVLAVFETVIDGKPVRSPDHWQVQSPGAPGATFTNVNLRRSKGYEGFAASKDGKFIYGLLEGPVWDAEKKDWEKVDGKEAARIVEFDVKAEKFTGRSWQYVFENNGHAIGDFNMITADNGLVIERDNGEGTADKACPEGQKRTDCFHDLAKFKRVYKIEMLESNVGGPVRKIGYIDLLNIADPNKLARKPLNDGVLKFPFFTIENVDVVDATHIVVGNDNNLPFSSSREPNKADDNELVLLEAGALLQA
eukprot:gene33345-44633_t